MKSETTVAIAKGIKTAAVSAAANSLLAGTYPIDTVIRIKGSVKKGEDYNQVVHMAVPQWNVIAVLMSKVNGVTLDSVIREALAMPEDAVTVIKKAASDAIKTIKEGAVETCQGKITTDLVFEEVEILHEATVEAKAETLPA